MKSGTKSRIGDQYYKTRTGSHSDWWRREKGVTVIILELTCHSVTSTRCPSPYRFVILYCAIVCLAFSSRQVEYHVFVAESRFDPSQAGSNLVNLRTIPFPIAKNSSWADNPSTPGP